MEAVLRKYRPETRHGWIVEALYVLAVTATAAAGFTSESTALILVAFGLALPLGLPALIAYYLGYGLLTLLPDANPDAVSGSASCSRSGCEVTSTGDPASWFTFMAASLGVCLVGFAAVVNLMLLRWVLSRRRRLGSAAR